MPIIDPENQPTEETTPPSPTSHAADDPPKDRPVITNTVSI